MGDPISNHFSDGSEVDFAGSHFGEFRDDYEGFWDGYFGEFFAHFMNECSFPILFCDHGNDPGAFEGIGHIDYTALVSAQ